MKRFLYAFLLLIAAPAWAEISNPGMFPTGAITPNDLTVYKDASGFPTLDPGIGTLSGRIVNLANPVNPLDAANKSYVDGLSAGLVAHAGARVATTATLTATYGNGSAGVGATLTNAGANAALSIDGVALSAADRVLVKDMTAQADNGIYSVTTVGDGSTPWVITRTTDFDQATASELASGAYLSVAVGTANIGTIWIETCPGPFTIGTTAVCFTKLGNTYSAGSGITLSGTVFSLTAPVTVPLGGTGDTSLTAHAPLLGEGTSAVAPMAAGTNGQLIVGQTGADPLWKTITGNWSLTSAGVATVVAVNNVAYPASPSTNTVPVVTGTNTVTYEALPNAALLNPQITVNGVTCTLGSTCSISNNITLASAHLFVGSAGNVATDTALSGDCSITNAGVITCPNALGGTVTSVGLSVPATSIFGVTGSPVTTSGTLGLTTTGTSGGIPYFSSTTQLASSALLTTNVLVKGGGAGAAPTTSSITDNGTTVSTAEIVNTGGVGVTTGDATQSIPNNVTTAPVLHKLVILSAGAYTATIATTGSTTNVIGVCDANCATSGSATVAWAGLDSCIFDGGTTAGDWVVASITTAGDCHDGGSTVPTAVQVLGQVTSTNVGAGTYNVDLNPVGVASAINAKTSPGGTNGQIQYNNAGAFGGFTASGDWTINTTTGIDVVGRVDGVTYPASPSINTVPVVTSATSGGTVTYEAIPAAALAACSSSSSNFACLSLANLFTAHQQPSPVALTDASTITVNGTDANLYTLTLTGSNHTLACPTTIDYGTYNFRITQDVSGHTGFAVASCYKFPGGTAPTWSTSANAIDLLSCSAFDNVRLECNALTNEM